MKPKTLKRCRICKSTKNLVPEVGAVVIPAGKPIVVSSQMTHALICICKRCLFSLKKPATGISRIT